MSRCRYRESLKRQRRETHADPAPSQDSDDASDYRWDLRKISMARKNEGAMSSSLFVLSLIKKEANKINDASLSRARRAPAIYSFGTSVALAVVQDVQGGLEPTEST